MRRLLAFAALLALGHAAAAQLAVPADGWASWEVEAGEGAQNWCCIQWKRKPASHVACDLDGGDNGYGTAGRDDKVATMHIYARLAGGKLEKIRALGPSCEVSTQTAIRDLGKVPAGDSARWIQAHARAEGRTLDDSLAALSVHRGSAPQLIALATTDPSRKVRSQAWFWLAQSRARETESAVAAALKVETDKRVRDQAIFALSQLPAERAVDALAAIIRDTSLSREDRKQAVFWMGQVDSPLAVGHLDRLLGGR